MGSDRKHWLIPDKQAKAWDRWWSLFIVWECECHGLMFRSALAVQILKLTTSEEYVYLGNPFTLTLNAIRDLDPKNELVPCTKQN